MMRISRILLALTMASAAWSAVVPRLDFGELVEASPWILHARVLDSRTASSGQFIWTHYRVQVLDAIKGDYPGEITVSEPGGTLNGVSMAVDGAVGFEAGEEVVLFLYRTPIGYWRTSGHWQGKFNIRESGGVRRVLANLNVSPRIDVRRRAAGSSALETLDGIELEEFKAAVRRQAGL